MNIMAARMISDLNSISISLLGPAQLLGERRGVSPTWLRCKPRRAHASTLALHSVFFSYLLYEFPAHDAVAGNWHRAVELVGDGGVRIDA